MADSPQRGFDFDAWRVLAQNDPDAFEAARAKAVRELIDEMPAESRRRLIGLQWRIDMERTRAANPTAAFLKLSDMMWDSFYRQREQLKLLLEPRSENLAGAFPAAKKNKDTGASIIPLRSIN